ncbi:Retrovirus-related Pol polyprotein from transposon TNT 1-94, partial [Bienertia sinuspersici]
GNLISHIIFKGDNYISWSRALTLSLKARRKFGFVDGSIIKPTNSDDILDWDTVNSMVVSWINRTLDPKILSSIPFHDTARALWLYLEKRYCVANGPRLQQLRAQITDCRQLKSMSVEDYYTKLMGLYDELDRLKPLHHCSCGKCTCGVVDKFRQDRDEEKLHQFYIGIDDDNYGAVRTNLLSQTPSPDLDRAYQTFLQEERSRSIARTKSNDADTHVFALSNDRSRSRPRSHEVDKSTLVCSYCKKRGHERNTCFELHGKPSWWFERYGNAKGSNSSANSGQSAATTVSRPRGGHANSLSSIGDGILPLPPPVSAATSAAGPLGSSSGLYSYSHPDNNNVPQPSLGPAQVHSLLNAPPPKYPDDRMIGKSFCFEWIIDSGASHHVTGNYSCLHNITHISEWAVGLPDGRRVSATLSGSVQLSSTITLSNVLYVPGLNCNLLSVSCLLRDCGCLVRFTDTLCAIQDQRSGMLIGAGEQRDGLYYFRDLPAVCVVTVAGLSEFELWHRRMGHPSDKILKLVPAINSSSHKKCLNKACVVCPQAKQTRDPFPVSDFHATRAFELIHCDLWGPYSTPSSCNAVYFLTIVDDYSRGVWVYLLENKTEVFSSFNSFFAMVTRQFELTVKYVRSDNGTEFNCMKNYFDSHGIIFQTSCVDTPQQNGRVERKHQHILNVGRDLRFQANLPISFWGECILGAVYLINRTPSPLLGNKTPFEMLYNTPPNFDELRVFGCLCFAHNKKARGDKFASRSRKCIFVGYPATKKGWKVYDIETGEIFVSRDVKFSENEFPFSDNIDDSLPNEALVTDHNAVLHDDLAQHPSHSSSPFGAIQNNNGPHLQSPQPTERSTPSASSSLVESGPSSASPRPSERSIPSAPTSELPTGPSSASHQPSECSLPSEQQFAHESGPILPSLDNSDGNLGRGFREKRPSVLLRDYVTTSTTTHTSSDKGSSSHAPCSDSSSGTPYPIAHYVNCDNFSVPHRTFLAAILSRSEPRSFREAMQDDGWRQAMQQEIKALEDNHTWELTDLPPDKKALGSRWVYKVKYNADGSVERLKARLVIFGNHQVEGIDYNETFAPVAKMVTVRAFLAVAAAKGWELHQMDVHNAFLHGDLTEEVYMKPPPGFSSRGKVCRLLKSLYGLKQAPRCWFAKLSASLTQYGFRQSYSDYSLFTYRNGSVHLNVLVYVDDLIISGNDSSALHTFKQYLSTCFHMKDLGRLKYFLGIEVARNDEGILLCQRKYALDIISEAGLLGAKPAPFPIEQNHSLGLARGDSLSDPERYRRLVGRLIYLSFTRPDLAYAVHILAQFMQAPRMEHWDAALRVVRYLKGSPGQGILLPSNCDLRLIGWCDSDWASCPLTRRSLTGWIVFLGGSPISWKTKKQHTISRSSAEAEYRSMASVTCELKWLKGLLSSLGVDHPGPMQLYCDSKSALHIAQNPVFHERTKHIEIDCHNVRDAIQDGLLSTCHVPTNEQLADIFTKALGHRQFAFLLRKLGIYDPHAPT